MPLEPVDPALHRMPQPVGHRVERRRPAALAAPGPSVAAWSSLSGMVQPILRRRRSARLARELSALSASTRSGRVRGRPGPRRGTRMPPRTAQTAGCRRAGRRSPRSTAAAGHPRPPGAACSSARPGSARGQDLGARCRPARCFALPVPPLRAPAACCWALATVESTLTSQVIKPLTSAWACNRVRICCQVPSAASGETAHRRSARAHSGPAHHARARRCGSASGSRQSAGVCSTLAAGRTSYPWAATAPGGPTAGSSGLLVPCREHLTGHPHF
jgi:hypothetical protein